MRPAYVHPESKDLSTTLLEKAFDKVRKRCTDHENAPGILFLCIKKHNNRKCALFFTRDLYEKNMFLKCCNLSIAGENLVKELSEITAKVIDLAKNVHSLNVFAVLSSEKIDPIDNHSIHFVKCNVKIAHRIAESLNDVSLFDKIYDIFQECTETVYLLENCQYDLKKLPLVNEPESWITHFQIFNFFLGQCKWLEKTSW